MSWNRAIWLGGVARSGTSWLGQILNSHPEVRYKFQPLFSHELKGKIDEDSSSEECAGFLNELWRTKSEFLDQADKVSAGEYPRFRKSGREQFLAFKENRYQSMIEPVLRKVSRLSFVGMIRHPCAVINSWRKNSREFPNGANLRDHWRFGACKNAGPEDYFGYFKWKEVANLYLDLMDKSPDRAHVIQFEELVRERKPTCDRLMKFLELPMHEQTELFLRQSGERHSNNYYSVFKSADVVDRWRQELDRYIVSEIYDDLEGTRLARFLDESVD